MSVFESSLLQYVHRWASWCYSRRYGSQLWLLTDTNCRCISRSIQERSRIRNLDCRRRGLNYRC